LVPRLHALYSSFPLHWYVAAIIVTGGYLAVLAIALGWLSWIRWRWLTVAGSLTYPFYLLHQQIGYILLRKLYQGLGWPPWLLVALVVLIMLGLAWVVCRYLERPFATWMRNAMNRSLASIRAELSVPGPADGTVAVGKKSSVAAAGQTIPGPGN